MWSTFIMKLYLSSYKLGDNPEQFSELFGENKNVGIILNAGDVYGRGKKADYLSKEIANLAEIALQGQDLDLQEYFDQPDELRARLDGLGGVWVMGGNSFALRRAMRASGFDVIAKEMILNNGLVYGGFSAGAVVATPSLRGIEIDDDPEAIPAGYPADIVWEGMGLVGYSIAPHYRSDHPESPTIEKVVKYFQDNGIAYRALHDGEAIVVSE